MAYINTNKAVFLAKNGGTPTSSDSITLSEAVIVNPEVAVIEIDEIAGGTLGTKTSAVDEYHTTTKIDMTTSARTSGTAGTAPAIRELLLSSGLAETVTADTDVEYKPTSAATPSTTITTYVNDLKRDITGSFADLTFSGKVGEPAKFAFGFAGYTTAAPTAASNPSVSRDTNDILVVSKVSGLTVGGTTLNATEFTFKMNAELNDIYAIDKSEFSFDQYDPTIEITALKTKENEVNGAWKDFINEGLKSIVITIGNTAGNIIELTIPYARLKGLSDSADTNRLVETRTYRAESNSGDDNFVITFK
jgi:hypothetical protein